MKKIVLILSLVALAGGLSSCFRHNLCATYTKNEVKPAAEPVALDQERI